jgi:hypothetical protein
MLNEQEEKAIQAYRFSRQIGTKAEAARRLIEKGLEAERMALETKTATSEPASSI